MPFVPMQAAAYKDPWGPARFGRWLQNLAWLRGGFECQHLPTLASTTRAEVARVCRRITFTGPSTYAARRCLPTSLR